MNTTLVKTAPHGNFAAVSVLMNDWEVRFQMLVSQKQAIQFDMYPKLGIPAHFKVSLSQQGYNDLVLANDRWLHYLVPQANG